MRNIIRAQISNGWPNLRKEHIYCILWTEMKLLFAINSTEGKNRELVTCSALFQGRVQSVFLPAKNVHVDFAAISLISTHYKCMNMYRSCVISLFTYDIIDIIDHLNTKRGTDWSTQIHLLNIWGLAWRNFPWQLWTSFLMQGTLRLCFLRDLHEGSKVQFLPPRALQSKAQAHKTGDVAGRFFVFTENTVYYILRITMYSYSNIM